MERAMSGKIESGRIRGPGPYRKFLTGTFGLQFSIRPSSFKPFEAEVSGYSGSHLRFAEFRFPAHTTSATRRDSTEPNVLISLQRKGQVLVQQDGRQCEVSPGQMFMVNASRPFRIETSDMETVALVLRAALLRHSIPNLDLITACAIETHAGAGAIFKGFVDDLIARRDTLSERQADALSASIPHMIAASYIDAVDQKISGSWTKEFQRKKIFDFIERELGNQSLSVTDIASGVGLSKRYVHELFSESGITVMAFVWGLRLERARVQLALPSTRHSSVSEVAASWGFKHQASFSRMFRKAYGLSPREFRQRYQSI